MPIHRFNRIIKNINRLRQILTVLSKHGFGHLLAMMGMSSYLPLRRRFAVEKESGQEVKRLSIPQRAYLVLEELGPTFIKFGQVLSTRPDLVSQEFIEEFCRLQDQIAPFPFEEAREIVETQLGKSLGEVYASFDQEPVAAASIAQVHKATLLDGTRVVVKIQRPRIRNLIETDLDILYTLASIAEREIAESHLYDPVGIMDEFSRAIRREMDFTSEANSYERFRRNFIEDEHIVIPRIYREFSSAKIITIEEVRGIKINDYEALEQAGHDKKKIAARLIDAYMKQFFQHGYFQADPHSGNLFVLPGDKIAIIDCGLMGHLDDKMMDSIANIFIALIHKEIDKLIDEYLKLGMISEDIDIESFRQDAVDCIDRYTNIPLKDLKIGDVLNDTLNNAIKHQIKLKPDFLFLVKTLMIIESLAGELDPDLNIIEISKPYAKSLLQERMSPKHLYRALQKVVLETTNFLRDFPHDLDRILKKTKSGKLKIINEHKGLEPILNTIDRVGNRIAFSLVLGMIAISSSIILYLDKGPHLFGYSFLGLFGYAMCAVLGFWLLIAIIRSGRL